MRLSFIPALAIASLLISSCNKIGRVGETEGPLPDKPNVIVLIADQWRAQATGYAGDPNVRTPNLDQLALRCINFTNAVSGMPVCSPFRASFFTGQRPLSHGVFMNDVQLDTTLTSIGQCYAAQGYSTGYIGKWHVDGNGRSSFIPPGQRRRGFQFWMANECSHNYNHSPYYENENSHKKIWPGYDAVGQTNAAIEYIKDRIVEHEPYFLVLSWGTPHAPYLTAPEDYRKRYHPDSIQVRPNVPEEMREMVRRDLAGYYAHITVLDDMIERLTTTLDSLGQMDNTIILFTSDHGDLLGSHHAYKKQQPYDESIRVPMLLYVPPHMEIHPGEREAMINSEDIMPTLLGFSNIVIPASVEGINYKAKLESNDQLDTVALIACVQPFGQWNKVQHGAREYRGIRTTNFTYVRDLNGPWLLFDNRIDPYQLNNLADDGHYSALEERMNQLLTKKLASNNDEFKPGLAYLKEWGYPVDETGTVPYGE